MKNIFTEQQMEDYGIDFNLVIQFPLDKYIDNILNYQPETGATWKPATAQEKDSFPIWRKMEFDQHQNRLSSKHHLNFSTLEYNQLQETKLIISLLSTQPYFSILSDILNGSMSNDFYFLARFCGVIDHIKKVLFKPTMQAIAAICIFKGETSIESAMEVKAVLNEYWGKTDKSAIDDFRKHYRTLNIYGFYADLDNGQVFDNRFNAVTQAISFLEGSQKNCAEATLQLIKEKRKELVKDDQVENRDKRKK